MPRALTWLRSHWRPVAFAAALLVAFAAGWAAHRPVPKVEYRDRVQVQTRVVEHQVEHVVYRERKQAVHQRATHRVEVTRPDGTKVVTVDTATAAELHVDTASALQLDLSRLAVHTASRETSLVQTPAAPTSWRVSALVGLRLPLQPVYGGEAARRVVGPLWLGGWGLSSGEGGVSLGLEF